MAWSRVRRGVSIVVVTHRSATVVGPFLDHLRRVAGPQDEIILVDNGSDDGTLESLHPFAAEQPEARRVVASPQNLGYAAAVNLGLHYVDRGFVALLHPDVLPAEDWLLRLLDHLAAHPGAVAIDAGDGTPGAGVMPAAVLHSGCVVVVSDALDRALGLDERYFFGGELRSLSQRLLRDGGAMLRARDVAFERLPAGESTPKERLWRRYLRMQGEQLFAAEVRRLPQDQRRALLAADEYEAEQGPVSIVIPVLDNLDLTRRCVESIFQNTGVPFELIVVDNGSGPAVAHYVRQLQSLHPEVIYLRNERNEGFGHACNQGFAVATGRFVALLNNDVRVTAHWLERMLALLRIDAQLALVGPRTNRASGPQVVAEAAQVAAGDAEAFAEVWAREHRGEFSLVTRVVGLCWVMRRAVIDEIGGFDPCFGLGNFEDDDLCLRVARRGWLAGIADDVYVHHEGSATFREHRIDYATLMRQNWRWFCAKWGHHGRLGESYPARDLALARPFSSTRDHVPVAFSALYSPQATPLVLEGARERRLLLFADVDDPGWEAALLQHLRATANSDPVTLVVRIEPPLPDVVDPVSRRIEQIVAQSGIAEADLPDVLLETTPLCASERPGLYTAVAELLSAPGMRQAQHEREARACGVAIVDAIDARATPA